MEQGTTGDQPPCGVPEATSGAPKMQPDPEFLRMLQKQQEQHGGSARSGRRQRAGASMSLSRRSGQCAQKSAEPLVELMPVMPPGSADKEESAASGRASLTLMKQASMHHSILLEKGCSVVGQSLRSREQLRDTLNARSRARSHTSPARQYWVAFVSALALCNFLVLTYLNGFYLSGRTTSALGLPALLVAWAYLSDLVFLVDAVLSDSYFGARSGTRVLPARSQEARAAYRSAHAVWDVASLLPLDVLALPFGPTAALWFGLRLNRVLKCRRLVRHLYHADVSPPAWRVRAVGAAMAVLVHVAACLFGFEALHAQSGETWVTAAEAVSSGASAEYVHFDLEDGRVRYLRAVYFVVTAVSTVGFGDAFPYATAEKIMTALLCAAGVFYVAQATANMTVTVGNMGATSTSFKSRTNRVRAYMEQEHAPATAAAHVLALYGASWDRSRGADEEVLLESVDEPLRCSLIDFRASDALAAAGRGCLSPEVVTHLARLMRPVTVVPGCTLFDEKSPVLAAYVVTKGSLAACASQSARSVEAPAGTCLGFEDMVLNRPYHTYMVVSQQDGVCETLQLAASDFDEVMAGYPSQRADLEAACTAAVKANPVPVTTCDASEEAGGGGYVHPEPSSNAPSRSVPRASRASDRGARDVVGGSANGGAAAAVSTATRTGWYVANAFFTAYYLLAVPYRFGFYSSVPLSEPGMAVWVAVDYLVDAFFVADAVIRWRHLGRVNVDGLVSAEAALLSRSRGARSRAGSRAWLVPTVLSLTPLDLVGLGLGSRWWCALRMIRFLKIHTVPAHARAVNALLDRYGVHYSPENVRIMWMAGLSLLAAHVLSALWFFVGVVEPEQPGWIQGDEMASLDSVSISVLRSWYFVMTALVTLGTGDVVASTVMETVLAIAIMFTGATFFTGVVANFLTLVSDEDPDLALLATRKEQYDAFLASVRASPDVRSRVMQWLAHESEAHRGLTDAEVYRNLPHYLRQEIAADRVAVLKAGTLAKCSDGFLRDAAVALERISVPARTNLFLAGESAAAIYFVKSGSVRMMDRHNSIELSTVSEGQVIGEFECLTGGAHEGAARTGDNLAEVFVLHRADLLALFEQHPGQEPVAVAEARAARERDGFIKKIEENLKKGKLSKLGVGQVPTDADLGHKKRLLIRQNSKFWFFWRLASSVAAIYMLASVPFGFAFLRGREFSDHIVAALLALDTLVDLFFFVDLYLMAAHVVPEQRKTPAGIEPELTEPGQIFRRYASGWFLPDLVATLPFDALAAAVVAAGTGSSMAFAVEVRLGVRLAKAVRFARIVSYTRSVEHLLRDFAPKISRAAMQLSKLAFATLATAHVFACGWQLLTNGHSRNGRHNVSGTVATEAGHQYLNAVYFSLTTMTTTGFGDLVPDEPAETGYVLFMMVLGAGFFGMVVAQLAAVAASMDATSSAFEKKVTSTIGYLDLIEAPESLRERVSGFLQAQWHQQRGVTAAELVARMPSCLRKALNMELLSVSGALKGVPELATLPAGALGDLAVAMTPVAYPPGTVLLEPDQCVTSVFVVMRGQVRMRKGGPATAAPEESTAVAASGAAARAAAPAARKRTEDVNSKSGADSEAPPGASAEAQDGDRSEDLESDTKTTSRYGPGSVVLMAECNCKEGNARLPSDTVVETAEEFPLTWVLEIPVPELRSAGAAAAAAAEAASERGRGSSDQSSAGDLSPIPHLSPPMGGERPRRLGKKHTRQASDVTGAVMPPLTDATADSGVEVAVPGGDLGDGRPLSAESPHPHAKPSRLELSSAALLDAAGTSSGPASPTTPRTYGHHLTAPRRGADSSDGSETQSPPAAPTGSPTSRPASVRTRSDPRSKSLPPLMTRGRRKESQMGSSPRSAGTASDGGASGSGAVNDGSASPGIRENGTLGDAALSGRQGDTKLRLAINVALLGCVLYNAFMVPVRLCFLFHRSPGIGADTAPDFVLDAVAWVITSVWVCLPVRDAPPRVQARTALAFFGTRRLGIGLWPVDWLAFPLGAAGAGLTTCQWWYLLRIARLLLSLEAPAIVARIRLRWAAAAAERAGRPQGGSQELSPNTLRLLKVLAGYVVAVHVLSCAFWLLGVVETALGLDRNSPTPSWIEVPTVFGYRYSDGPVAEQYVHALYFFTVVLSTTGFGDILPQTHAEKVFIILVVLLGAVLMALLMANFTDKIQLSDDVVVEKRMWQESMRQLLRSIGAPHLVSERALEVVAAKGGRPALTARREAETLSQLPDALRRTVASHIGLHLVDSVELFDGTSVAFKTALSAALAVRTYPAGQPIMMAGQLATEAFLLEQGSWEGGGSQGVAEHEQALVGLLLLGVADSTCPITLMATSLCTVRVLTRSNLAEALDMYPADAAIISSNLAATYNARQSVVHARDSL